MTTRREFGLALCCAAQLRAQDEPVFTADARDVPVDVAVTRSQRPLRGLRAEDFLLFENGRPQPVRAVTGEELPLDVVFLFHTIPNTKGLKKSTVRITEPMRARMLNGAANVLLQTRPADRVAFLTHTEPPRIQLPFTNDRNAMAAALRSIAAMEQESGFAEPLTIEYAVRMLLEVGPAPGRRRLIVRLGTFIGSGVMYSDEPTIHRLWGENILFSSIEILFQGGGFNPGFGTAEVSLTGDSFGRREPDGPLYRVYNPNHIAQATGGDALQFLDPKDPLDLLTPLRQRYILWFRQPDGLAAGEQRKISVELSATVRERYPDVVVRARAGYVTR